MGKTADTIRAYNYQPKSGTLNPFLDPEFLELCYEVGLGNIEPTPQQVRRIALAAYENGIGSIEGRIMHEEGILHPSVWEKLLANPSISAKLATDD